MNFADRVKETTTSTSAAVITLDGAVATFRAFAAALAVGDTKIPVSMDDGAGNWENGEYTLTNATTLTRTAIYASSNGGAPTVFPEGLKEVFCTITSESLASFLTATDGLSVDQLPATTTIGANDLIAVSKPGNGDFKMTFAALQTALGGTPQPGDTTPPTFVSAQVANATPSRIDITMSESLANSVPVLAAFTVSGGKTVSSVTISGAVVSVTVNSPYASGDTITVGYTKPNTDPRLQDAAGNATETFSGRSVTNNVVPVGSTVTSVNVSPSAPTIAGGGTQQFLSTVNGTSSPSQGVTWSASIGTITAGGLWTAPAATSSTQTATITATSQQDGTKSGTATATIPSAAQQSYTITPNSSSSVPKTSVAASERTTDYGTALRFVHVPALAASGAWKIAPTPASAVAGWGTSGTVPPATITSSQNKSGPSSINGMVPMGNPSGNWTVAADLMTTGPGASGPYYLWIKPVDGAAFCVNPSAPLYITAA